jgi:outer membrane lipoprotein-sorting protein
LTRKFWSAALLGFCAMGCATHLQAGQTPGQATTESVLAMMDKSAADFRSLTAALENTKFTDVVKDSSTETGHIFVRRDQKMRIEIQKPDPRTILRSGDSLFVYTPKIKRVEEYDLGKNRAMVDQYVLLGFGTKSQNMLKSYDVKLTGEEQLDGKKTFVLELTPKSDEVRRQITKIQMWIDESSWLPIQQKFFETGSGDYIQFHYSDVMKNLKISDSRFKQDWPKDVNRVKPRG